MQSPALKYILIAVIILVLAGIGFYVYRSAAPSATAPSGSAMPVSAENAASSTPAQSPRVDLAQKDKSTLAINWQNLPAGTAQVNIFRSLKNKNAWTKWQTIGVSLPQTGTLTNGTTYIGIGSKENLDGYSYYFQAISGSGDPLYTSPAAQNSSPQSSQNGQGFNLGGAPQGSAGGTPLGQFFNLGMATNTSTNQQQNNSFNQGAPTSSPQAINNQTNPTGTPGVSNQTSSPPKATPTGTVSALATGLYYNPQGDITGSGVQEASFWAMYVNGSAEIGWQGLPANTDDLIVYRSLSANGPWTKLIEQKNPMLGAPDFVRIADDTANGTYYYQMDVFADGNKLQTYGPVVLPPAEQTAG